MTPSYRNVFDTCLTPGTIFASDNFLWGPQLAFLCSAWVLQAGQCGFCSSGPELRSLINQEPSVYPVGAVFNYSADFNIIWLRGTEGSN